MTSPTIHLALVDDWELSGNGSGDVRQLQFEPMRKLVDLYQECGIRGSFNAEVMQQIYFRKHQTSNPELKVLADEWDENVSATLRRGHDIQLHIHPQWTNAEYKDGRWTLKSDWSILNYDRAAAKQLLIDGKDYLENLLRQVNPDYRCVSFRSGAWCIAPSPHMLALLVELDIVFDMSIVAGVRYDTRNIKLDYSQCEETFLPYYPVMNDARRVSNKVEPVICIPTNCFYASRSQVFQQHLKKLRSKIAKSSAAADGRGTSEYGMEWAQVSDSSTVRRIYNKGFLPYISGKHYISDLAQLDYGLLREMLDSIRRRAKASGHDDVPVVLENHTKDLRDFTAITRFLKELSSAPDIRFATLTDIANAFKNHRFKIRTAAPN